MVTIKAFREMCLSFPETQEQPHFEKTSFRINKKIFATLNETESIACLKLTPEDQYTYSRIDKKIIYPVPNKWGTHGYTFINLALIKKSLLQEILDIAYRTVAPKKITGKQ